MKIVLLLCTVSALLVLTRSESSEDSLKKVLLRLLKEDSDKTSEDKENVNADEVDDKKDDDEASSLSLLRGLVSLSEFKKCHKCEKVDMREKALYCRVSAKNAKSGDLEICDPSRWMLKSNERYEECSRNENSKCDGEVKICDSGRCVKTSKCTGPIECKVYTRKCTYTC